MTLNSAFELHEESLERVVEEAGWLVDLDCSDVCVSFGVSEALELRLNLKFFKLFEISKQALLMVDMIEKT